MKISEVIKTLEEIKAKFGDIDVTGGYMQDDRPLDNISVTEEEGMEIWPENPNNLDLTKIKVDGVFFSS